MGDKIQLALLIGLAYVVVRAFEEARKLMGAGKLSAADNANIKRSVNATLTLQQQQAATAEKVAREWRTRSVPNLQAIKASLEAQGRFEEAIEVGIAIEHFRRLGQ